MIPRVEDCNWNETRPWSDWERSMLRTLTAALNRVPDLDVPSLPRGMEAPSVSTNAHRLLLQHQERTTDG